ncbi:MAG: O-antigen ligase family protein [Pyrinomonadaceae bacterium]|nr:O-antigen ligase family protein [Pyrinomonadaceae bacterium]
MTTSISNSLAETQAQERPAKVSEREALAPRTPTRTLVHTVASRFVILMLCLALLLSTLAYGTVHYWALGLFQLSAALVVFFWAVDAWRTGVLRVSRSSLQLPLLGLCLLALVQLLPLGSVPLAALPGMQAARTLSLDPYSTRLILVQLLALLVYFSASLVFIDSPRRLRLVTHTIIIFSFALAIFGLIQSFVSPAKIYGIKELGQSTSFGPFVNRHHFAAYMEMAAGLTAGLLMAGAIQSEKRLLYIFAAIIMAVALVMTNSRGGIISLVAETIFIFIITGARRERHRKSGEKRAGAGRVLMLRAGLAFALLFSVFTAVVFFGGEDVLSRFVGTVNSADPTTGRVHFWRGTLDIIRDHPVAGSGLGSFAVAYTLYDTRNGIFRLEQAHNDYLQVLSDAGIIGAILGLCFVVLLFRKGFARRETDDAFRRGVATGALVGCFAVLVHSFFDFTLHTAANSLLFLTLAALATVNGNVEENGHTKRRRRRRHRSSAGEAVS